MQSGLTHLDYIIFATYVLIIVFFGLWFSRTKKGEEKSSNDYFLASRSLTWWVIGGSLIASNISAEQFIGMSGSGYAIGLAIAAYEWIAAVALIIVGKYFLPIFLNKKIYTMPQFLTMRFDKRVSTSLAVFFLLLYVFVNLTSVSYLGALAILKINGFSQDYLVYIIILLFCLASLLSLWGGLKSVAYTDIIQVIFLIGGGLVTSYAGLTAVAAKFGGSGFIDGLKILYDKAPLKFDLILSPDNPQYHNLPGIAVLLGFMLLTNIGYWGLNQFIIQRGLAAKSINEARRGVIFAGYLKLLIPLIVVIPGIIVFVSGADIAKPDEAYPWLLRNYVPMGIRGLTLAALIAAIVSTLASLINSTSTIFTLDIFRNYFNNNASEHVLVRTGRISGLAAVLIATMTAPMLTSLDQAFQYIQEFTGFIYPAIIVIYFIGLFWKQATSIAALWVAIICLPLSVALKFIYPDLPFMDRMGFVFIMLSVIAVVVSLADNKNKITSALPDTINIRKLNWIGFSMIGIGVIMVAASLFIYRLNAIYVTASLLILLGFMIVGNANVGLVDPKNIDVKSEWFKTSWEFNILSLGICSILFVLYYFLH